MGNRYSDASGVLRQRIFNGLAHADFQPAKPTLVFSVCNEASFCTPVTPYRGHTHVSRRIVRKTQRSRTGAEHLVPLPFAKGAISSPSLDGPRSSVSTSSVRISPALPFPFPFPAFASTLPLRLSHVAVPSCCTSTAVPRDDERPMDRYT